MIRVATAALAFALVSSTAFAQSPWCDRQLASPRVTQQEIEVCHAIGAVQRGAPHEIPQPAAPKAQAAKIQPSRPEATAPVDPAVDPKCGTVSFRSITR
jgi:hypothetical protein